MGLLFAKRLNVTLSDNVCRKRPVMIWKLKMMTKMMMILCLRFFHDILKMSFVRPGGVFRIGISLNTRPSRKHCNNQELQSQVPQVEAWQPSLFQHKITPQVKGVRQPLKKKMMKTTFTVNYFI